MFGPTAGTVHTVPHDEDWTMTMLGAKTIADVETTKRTIKLVTALLMRFPSKGQAS